MKILWMRSYVQGFVDEDSAATSTNHHHCIHTHVFHHRLHNHHRLHCGIHRFFHHALHRHRHRFHGTELREFICCKKPFGETELTFHDGFLSINGGWRWLMTKSTIAGEDLIFRNLIRVWRRFEFLDLQKVGEERKLGFVSWNLQNEKE